MTFIESLTIIIFVVFICVVFTSIFYTLGKEDGYKAGYAKGRKEVNTHLDAYLKNGGWKV